MVFWQEKQRNKWKTWWTIVVILIFSGERNFLSHSLSAPVQNISEMTQHLQAQTEAANALLKSYDKRFIPAKEGKALQVKLEVHVADVLKVDNMEAEMIIYIRQTWYDFRLKRNSSGRLKVREHFLDKIWIPDIRIINLKEAKKYGGFGGVNMNVYPNGRVYLSQLVHVKISCPMKLQNFPMDQQTCFLNFSSFAYVKSLLHFFMSKKKVVVRHCELPQFKFVKAEEVPSESTGHISKVTIGITFQRRAGYYIIQVYIPASFLVVLSWLAFFMEPTDIADRLALEITMILSTVFLLDGTNSSVVHVSYAKASDLFLIISFAFIFVALLETMLVYRLSAWNGLKKNKCGVVNALTRQISIIFSKKKENNNETESERNTNKQRTGTIESSDVTFHQDDDDDDMVVSKTEVNTNFCNSLADWIDKVSLVLFPAMFLGFHLFYWNYYSIKTK